MTKAVKEAKNAVAERVSTDPAAAIKVLMTIFKYQTADEQSGEFTRYSNNVGFSAFDAEILCSFANQIKHFNPQTSRYSSPLSVKQIALLQKKIKRYAGQFVTAGYSVDNL